MSQSKIIFEKTYENGWYKKLVSRSKPTENCINAYLRSPKVSIGTKYCQIFVMI